MSRRIGILGANGQVGLEVCLLLARRDDVEVVAFCRNPVASAVCRRYALEVRHYDIQNPANLEQGFADLDLLVDLTLPVGSASRMRATIDTFLSAVFSAVPRQTAFVYGSSLATTIAGDGLVRPSLVWPRNAYAAVKRFGEKRATALARAQGTPLTILRLGQVHGRMQGVSLELMSQPLPAMTGPGPLTCVVFCRTIADALSALARSETAPGQYALLSEPRWRLDEIASFYRLGKVVASPGVSRGDMGSRSGPLWPRGLLARFARAAKPFMTSVVLPRLPTAEAWLATRWRYSVAAREIAAMPDPTHFWASHVILGDPGDPRMTGLADIRSDPFGPAFSKLDPEPETKGNQL